MSAYDLAATIGTTGLSGWLSTNAVPLGVLIAGCVVVYGAKKKDWASAVNVFGIALLGLGLIGVSGKASAVGEFLAGLVVTG